MRQETLNGWACYGALEVEIPGGENEIVLVQDEDKPEPALWKMPGGCKDLDKGDVTPEDTVRREIQEEAGPIPVVIDGTICSISVGGPKPHTWLAYRIKPISSEQAEALKRGDEIKELRRFKISDVQKMLAYCQRSPSMAKMPPRHWEALDRHFQEKAEVEAEKEEYETAL